MSRLHHTNVRITDPAASLAFYGVLGMEHTGTLNLAPGYSLLYLSDGSGGALELVVNDTSDPAYDRSPGSGHLGFEVDDLPATLAQLVAVGAVAEADPSRPAGRADLNDVVFVRDPDGVRVELLQAPWPAAADAVPEALRARLDVSP